MPIIIDNGEAPESGFTVNPLTTNSVLTLALGKQHDTGSVLRNKALAWLNEAMQMLYLERDWLCLIRTVSLTAVDNNILLPSNYGSFIYAKGGDFIILPKHRLTDEEVNEYASVEGVIPNGFEETSENINFYPGAEGLISLKYVTRIPDYADNAETVFDVKFKNLLARSVLSAVYEYEENNRAIPSIQLDQMLLDRLKTEENRQKPMPKRSKYLRGRI
jgi:hypothetical protein